MWMSSHCPSPVKTKRRPSICSSFPQHVASRRYLQSTLLCGGFQRWSSTERVLPQAASTKGLLRGPRPEPAEALIIHTHVRFCRISPLSFCCVPGLNLEEWSLALVTLCHLHEIYFGFSIQSESHHNVPHRRSGPLLRVPRFAACQCLPVFGPATASRLDSDPVA